MTQSKTMLAAMMAVVMMSCGAQLLKDQPQSGNPQDTVGTSGTEGAGTQDSIPQDSISAPEAGETPHLTERYSQVFIDGCLYDYRANTTPVAFSEYDAAGKLVAAHDYGKTKLDYVPGLVAKAVIEAVAYYEDCAARTTDSKERARLHAMAAPWFYSIAAYGNHFADGVPTAGGSLDDLNAVKLYFDLHSLTREGGAYADAATAANCAAAIEKARQGLAAHNEKYSISATHATNPNTLANAQGGWWHKKNYINQLWCDGQYMGPALLAQLVAGGYGTITGSEQGDWDMIARQFEIAWTYLWDADAQLLWHAFSADGNAYDETTHAETWVVPDALHSGTYWGRAEGWYYMALIDVLAEMQRAGRTATPAYKALRTQLQTLATGLARRQDAASGCWYQLLGEDGSYSASEYNGKKMPAVSNYLESSCSFLFAACYMKAARLGLFTDNAAMRRIGERAYEGAVARFWDGEKLIDCCASAGLGGKGKDAAAGGEKMRSGSREYYLLGYDVTRVTTYTEGKVLGAAIMAAVEYERGDL